MNTKRQNLLRVHITKHATVTVTPSKLWPLGLTAGAELRMPRLMLYEPPFFQNKLSFFINFISYSYVEIKI